MNYAAISGVTLYYVYFFEDDDAKILPALAIILDYSTSRSDGGILLRSDDTNLNFITFKGNDCKYSTSRTDD